jgi:hypothetical protein
MSGFVPHSEKEQEFNAPVWKKKEVKDIKKIDISLTNKG